MPYKPRPCNRCREPFTPATSNSQFCDTCREAREEEKRQAMIERQTYTCLCCGETRFNDRNGPTPLFCPDKDDCIEAAKERRRQQNRDSASLARGDRPPTQIKRWKCWRCGRWTANRSKTCDHCRHVLTTTYADLDCYGGVAW